jgi:hypothetical protein
MTTLSTILVATDGREQSDGAIRAGALFGGYGDAWRIVSVVPPQPVVSAELDLHISTEIRNASRDERRRVVQEQLRRVISQASKVDVDVRSGDPADIVSRVATESGAKLIVTGLGRHRLSSNLRWRR